MVCGVGDREPQKVAKEIRVSSEAADLDCAGETQTAPLSPYGAETCAVATRGS